MNTKLVSLLAALGGLGGLCQAANVIANGDFSSGTFTGWTQTGTPTVVGGVAVLANGQGILQDFAPGASDGLTSFQANFNFSISQLTQAHRIRIEGNNGTDLITMRITASTTVGSSSIDTFTSAGAFQTAVTGINITTGTNYFLRVTGTGFGTASRSYTVGFSTDGVTYTTSTVTNGFHSLSATSNLFETITFEGGGTAGTALSIDNVFVEGTTIPEPATAILGVIGMGCIVLRRRK